MNEQLKNILFKSKLDKSKPIIVALSGGVDSMVLFDLLHRNQFNLVIAHVNHNKRPESKVEYEKIQELSYQLKIPFEGMVLHKDIEGNFQEEARKKRYHFFSKVAKEYHTDQIVLAHHADDQLETVLMRLTRGSSFKGYAGILDKVPYEDVIIYRPLLETTKEEIIQYANEHQITYFEDTSNAEDTYTRNRFRNNIIPLLKNENPLLNQKINQFSKYITMAEDHINKSLKKFTTKHIFDDKVDINAFNQQDDMIKFKIIQYVMNQASSNEVEVSYLQYQDIISLLLNDNPNIKYNLSKGFDLIKEYAYFYIQKQEKEERIFLEINGIGEYIISNEITYVFSYDKLDIRHTNSFEICYNKEVFPLYIRNKQNGDKMKLKIGTKKVKDILIDQKVPLSVRESLILIANNDPVMWIPRIKKSIQDMELPNKLYIYEVR